MDISVTCGCGKKMIVGESMAGEVVQCMRCRRKVTIPKAKAPPPPVEKPEEAITASAVGAAPSVSSLAEKPAESVAPPVAGATAGDESAREYVYLLLIMALFPLVLTLSDPQAHLDFEQKLKRTIKSLPEERREAIERIEEQVKLGELSFDDLMKMLPDQRMEGALFPRHTDMHWLFTLGATLLFWFVLCFCFSNTRTAPMQLLAVGLFTATMGLGVLMMIHISPLGIFIEMCMASAHEAAEDFLKVLGAFTLGVGFFEELSKQLPIIWYFRRYRTISWRRACLWGLASGVGFGISEGVMYSSMFYNGIEGLDAYLVRFASCVALHAVWAASAAVAVSKNQVMIRQLLKMPAPGSDRLDTQAVGGRAFSRLPHEQPTDWFALLLVALRVLAVVMFLHGLYDAALTDHMETLALVTALASFGWLAYQVEGERRRESEELTGTATVAA